MKMPLAGGLATAAVVITLYPLFAESDWLWTSLGVLVVTTGVGALASRVSAPAWAAPPAMLVAVVGYLTAVFARSTAWLWVIPTIDSARPLVTLLGTGFADIQRLAAPVPATPGIVLLTASGVGLIAIAVDLIAVRLRRAALAGLPLLALFTVPVAVLVDPIPWPAFMIGGLGFVGLLVTDGRERLGRWGPAVIVRRSRPFGSGVKPDTGRLAVSGKRVGITAVTLAIILPGLLPSLAPDPLFGFGVGNGLGGGSTTVGIPDAIVELGGQLRQAENATVFTYTTDDDQPRYFRIYALDVFDGEKWTISPQRGRQEDRISAGPLPPAPGLDPGVPVRNARVQVRMSEDIGELRFLPLPYPAIRVEADGDWRADRASLMVFSTRDQAAGLQYQVVTGEPQPSAADLDRSPPTPESPLLALPELDSRIVELAMKITAGAATPYQKAVHLQQWFTQDGGFVYSLRPSGHGTAALSRFLLEDRAGYCEQFASAMAVLARVVGIPARVASGYTGGTPSEDGWTVRTHDSHAWPELYFQGIGWLRFEPTPSGVTGQGTAQAPPYSVPALPSPGSSAAPSADSSADGETDGSTGATRPNPRLLDRETAGAVPAATSPESSAAGGIAVALAAIVLLALLPAAVRRMTWYHRYRTLRHGMPGTRAAWAELCDLLTDYGMARRPNESPRALGVRLAARHDLDPPSVEALTRIVSAEERRRYAPAPSSTGPRPADLIQLRRALAGRVSRRQRVAAALAPRSTLRHAQTLGERAVAVVDRWRYQRITARRDGAASAPPSAP